MNKRGAEQFFRYARARHSIYLDRAAGKPRPWSKDPILNEYRFTNVFRELDKTTAWFTKYVRNPLRNKPEVLLATVVFRLLNRIEVGEAVFAQTTSERGKVETAFHIFVETGDVRPIKRAIKLFCGNGPYVTGAYIISSPAGYSKLDGMMEVIRRFYEKSEWHSVAQSLIANRRATLEDTWNWLREFDYFGNFHSYEIVTDLRHTALLDSTPDIMSWANIGPGCRRGLNRILFGEKRGPRKLTEAECLVEMSALLKLSQDEAYWPQAKTHTDAKMRKQIAERWPTWEMREVEHTLCEFDKYMRVKNGEGKPRGVFR